MERQNKLKYIMPVVVLGIGLLLALYFITTPSTVKKRPPSDSAAVLVQTAPAEQGDYVVKVEAMGQVVPSKQIGLKPRISGAVVKVAEAYIPGGYFKKNAPMLYIDQEDYQLALQSQQALYRQAQADYQLEMGRQDIAKDELKILAKTVGKELDNSDLALRKPQLDQAQAALQIAKSNVDAAKLNLERTTIRAPFNALITERFATLGDTVSPSDTLATLISTDEYWVELSLPVEQIAWLVSQSDDPEHVSKAQVFLQNGQASREGSLLRVVGTLNAESRLANVLVSVPDPLLQSNEGDQAQMPLIVGDYVKVEIEGKRIEDAFRLPLSWIRDGSHLWVMRDNTLHILDVDMVYADREYAYLSGGLEPGDQVVTSDIITATQGMQLRVNDAGQAGGEVSTPDTPDNPNGDE